VVLFYLLVCECEYLKALFQGRLSGLCFAEVVHYSLVRISLLHVSVVEVDDRVPVLERLSSDFVGENHLFLAVEVDTLDFAILADNLVGNCGVLMVLIMVLGWECQSEVFLVLLKILGLLNCPCLG
jgi:hypothetical protein